MAQLVVIGSNSIDMLAKVKTLPKEGETVISNDFQTLPGGKGANQAVAAKRLGANVIFIGCVGNDSFGEQNLNTFKHEGLDTKYISIVGNVNTGIAQILIDDKGANIIAVTPGANNHVTPEIIRKNEQIIQSSDLVLLQMEIPIESITEAVNIASAANKTIILNPAPAKILPDSLYSKLEFITPNETEAEILTGIKVDSYDTAKLAADFLIAKGVAQVIITMGEDGVVHRTHNSFNIYPAKKITAIDTTGAGDTFNGAFACALTKKTPLKEAIIFACDAATVSVSKLGAQSAIPTPEELRAFQKQYN